MNIITYAYRFIVGNVLSLISNVVTFFIYVFFYLISFGDPLSLKLILKPPSCLSDPKYGIHKCLKVNNIKLHYVESGDPAKRLMIFVHGFPEFWYSWRHQILEFQKDYWCIAIDMRGYGDSERPDGVSAYKLNLLVDDIRDLVRQLGNIKNGLENCPDEIMADKVMRILYGECAQELFNFVTPSPFLLRSTRKFVTNHHATDSHEALASFFLMHTAQKWRREKCILVSHDWGGIVACRFRDVYPDALSAVVVLASMSVESWFNEIWSEPKQMLKSWYVFHMRLPWLSEKLFQLKYLAAFDLMFLNADKNTITKKDVECYKYWFGKQYTLTPPINYYRANFLFIVPEKKRCDLNIPFLHAMAEHDVALSITLLDSMKKEYKHIEPVVLKGCRHTVQQEDPDIVNKLIREFLMKHNL